MEEEFILSPEMMEKYLIPRAGRGFNIDKIKERFNEGLEIVFIVTKNFEIIIGELWHSDIRKNENLEKSQSLFEGSLWKKSPPIMLPTYAPGEFPLSFEDRDKIKRLILQKVTDYLKQP